MKETGAISISSLCLLACSVSVYNSSLVLVMLVAQLRLRLRVRLRWQAEVGHPIQKMKIVCYKAPYLHPILRISTRNMPEGEFCLNIQKQSDERRDQVESTTFIFIGISNTQYCLMHTYQRKENRKKMT